MIPQSSGWFNSDAVGDGCPFLSSTFSRTAAEIARVPPSPVV